MLLGDLRHDRARLESIKREGTSRLDQAHARLQTIEAAASRGASWTETNYMLQRLDEGQRHVPLALESARSNSNCAKMPSASCEKNALRNSSSKSYQTFGAQKKGDDSRRRLYLVALLRELVLVVCGAPARI